jgi:GntR family transcriptional regulator/MocR family aminotransferase
LVTSGTQHAIDIAIRVLLRPGDEVWVEDPGYGVTSAALLAAKVALQPIPVDAQGLDVRAGIAAAPRARAVFVTPSHQFPLGVVLSTARRLELLAWARDARAWIIEDDYQSEFRYAGRPLASLQGLDEADRVIYVGTLNKALFPGLRIGYAVVPPALLREFVTTRLLMDRQPPSLVQTVVAAFMREGHLSAHIRRMRLAYREQRDVLARELARRAGAVIAVEAAEQGMHLVAYLTDGRSDVALESAAHQAGLIVKAISPLYRKAEPRSGLLLGFSGFPPQRIIPAAARLARVIDEGAGRGTRQSR